MTNEEVGKLKKLFPSFEKDIDIILAIPKSEQVKAHRMFCKFSGKVIDMKLVIQDETQETPSAEIVCPLCNRTVQRFGTCAW